MKVKCNARLVVTPVRKTLHALKPKLQKGIKCLVDQDISKPIEKPTDCVNGLLVEEKSNGKLRICLDPPPLNNATKREHLLLLTVEEVFSQISGTSFLSKLDASSKYWQIEVDEEISHLLEFGTPLGRYRFKRLP